MQGQFIRRSSIHDSYQRCITIHASNMAQVVGNTCVNIFGHAYFLEDGVETGNLIEENIAIFVKKPPRDRALLLSDWWDKKIWKFAAPSAFWIAHPWNRVKNNVAIASEGTGFWMAYAHVVCCTAALACEVPDDAVGKEWQRPLYVCSRGQVTHRPISMAQFIFEGNTASSNVIGFTWDGAQTGKRTNNPLNPHDREIQNAHFSPSEHPTFRRLITYENSIRSLYSRGNPMTFEGCVTADEGGPQMAYTTLFRDYLAVGWSFNFEIDFFFDEGVRRDTIAGSKTIAALQMYDGPLLLENAHFAGYVNANTRWKNGVDVTPTILTPLGVAERFTNRAQVRNAVRGSGTGQQSGHEHTASICSVLLSLLPPVRAFGLPTPACVRWLSHTARHAAVPTACTHRGLFEGPDLCSENRKSEQLTVPD